VTFPIQKKEIKNIKQHCSDTCSKNKTTTNSVMCCSSSTYRHWIMMAFVNLWVLKFLQLTIYQFSFYCWPFSITWFSLIGSGDTTCLTEILTNLCIIIVQMYWAISVYFQSIFLFYHTFTSEFWHYQSSWGMLILCCCTGFHCILLHKCWTNLSLLGLASIFAAS
jgi:hypothetical protein